MKAEVNEWLHCRRQFVIIMENIINKHEFLITQFRSLQLGQSLYFLPACLSAWMYARSLAHLFACLLTRLWTKQCRAPPPPPPPSESTLDEVQWMSSLCSVLHFFFSAALASRAWFQCRPSMRFHLIWYDVFEKICSSVTWMNGWFCLDACTQGAPAMNRTLKWKYAAFFLHTYAPPSDRINLVS